jgi:peptidoglycan glycosyltransferase
VNISGSIRRLTNIFLVLFVALSAGLVYWQVVVAQQVTSNPYLTYTRQCTSESAPIRGKIFDRNGVLLAYSVPSNIPGLCGYKRVYTAAAQGLEGLIGYYISPLFGSTGIEKEFNDYLSGQNGVTGLDNTVNKILHVPPQGDDIYLTIDSRIEKILLKNFPTESPPIDFSSAYPTDRGSVIVSNPTTGEILGIVSQPGYDANCVINCTLDQLYKDFQAKSQGSQDPQYMNYMKAIGCASPCSMDQFKTALDGPKVQQVMNNQGASDSGSNCEADNDCNQIYLAYLNVDTEQPMIFRPTQDCYPPGSTYKTVTLMAALDSGTMGLNDPIFYNDPTTNPYPKHMQAEGPVTVHDGDLSDTFTPAESNILGYTLHFPVSLAYGFSHSDNVIFAEAGAQTGADTWLKYNKALYVSQKIPFDLPVKVSTVTPQPQSNLCTYNPQTFTHLDVPTLAEGAFGQGKDFVTPLQMMLVDNVAADDGKLMRPSLIQKIVDPKTQAVLQSFNPQMLSQPISQNTARGVRDAMYAVNACGSGSLNRVTLSYGYTPWAVIGKTGTAQVPKANPNENIGGDSWYITQAPYVYQSNTIPAITITAMKENGGEGAYANGPMLNADYNEIFSNIIKVQTPPPPPGGTNFCYQTGFLQAA